MVANSLEDFEERFTSLMEEAVGYGINSITMLVVDDPLNQTETKNCFWRGMGPVLVTGCAEWIKNCALNGKWKDED